MLKLSQQLNKLSKPILVYLAALQDVPGNPLNFATTLATAATTTTSYYVSSACTESPTAVSRRGDGPDAVSVCIWVFVIAIV
ncbi:hypothetical protein QBC32DRAFT_312170 [Pseudoneurospora amorphoporcata]|uniref:Uncharacterized protein n=1 Tax=Pseudoneurospora amorphoporcata TaxID=241081 RepID=A0AAN6P0B1_9PEZI|nr:hypothetical protein QBC32DRAFT_312170 [Pseudoneurospora amorphoporcata]